MSTKSASNTSPTKWQPGLKVYLILMNLVLLGLLFPTITVFFFGEVSSLRDAQLDRNILSLRQGLEGRALSIARSLSLSTEQAIAGYDYTFLNDLMANIVEIDREIIYAIVMDTKGRVIAHNQVDMIGSTFKDPAALEAIAVIGKYFTKSSQQQIPPATFQFIEEQIIEKGRHIPILEVVMPIHSGNKLSGVLRCGFSLESLNSATTQAKREWSEKMTRFKIFFLTITAIFFILGMVVALFFSRFFVNSTTLLGEGVHKVSDGDLNYVIPTRLMFCREFALFAAGFNKMTSQLRISLNQLDESNRSLEQKVQKRTRDLKEAQSELLQQAHEAGMAEMAVGVLHNIGNAITPAKVDAALLVRRLRDSPIRTSLGNITTEIANALNNPEQLSATDKNRLIEIANILPASIQEEYDSAIKGLSSICSRHEHIEGIINLQMRYAKLIDKNEEVDLSLVVTDALQMMNESIQQRSIEVETHLDRTPLIRIEQAKIIQIIINLIKNAYEAMDMADLPERRLIIRTYLDQEGPAPIVLSIKDTGCGFTPKEKEKMFQFGYTTKQTGSGFGLHSCANFMIAHNGSLTATSQGKGKGAEFTVRFQVAEDSTEQSNDEQSNNRTIEQSNNRTIE